MKSEKKVSPVLKGKEHKELMQKLGITSKEDREWHVKQAKDAVNTFAIGGGFLAYCVSQGWLKKDGSNYYSTPKGKKELVKFGIKV